MCRKAPGEPPAAGAYRCLEVGPAHGKVGAEPKDDRPTAEQLAVGGFGDPPGSDPLEPLAGRDERNPPEREASDLEQPPLESARQDDAPLVLDPLERLLASSGRPPPSVLTPGAPVPVLDQVAEQVLKRIQISGDGKSGKVRMELRLGELDGSFVELDYDDREGLQVHVELPNEATEEARRSVEALETRLRARGLPLTRFEVD